jgi:hypothetical protein
MASDSLDNDCAAYSDTFEFMDPDKWADILLLSESPGIVSIKDGRLVLEAPDPVPCETQVYALFTFENDFDLQADYEFFITSPGDNCSLNAGIVMQTLMDEKSYKVYASLSPGKPLYFKARADQEGENKIEDFKGDSIDDKGSLRVVKKDNVLSAYHGTDNQWQLMYRFSTPSDEKLRLRFKLQTYPGTQTGESACPAQMAFDNFTINSCTRIIAE